MSDDVNHVSISGNVGKIDFSTTSSGAPVCTFTIASDRKTPDRVITAWVKINVYPAALVTVCKAKLAKGTKVWVEGELMNREGRIGELTEIRARRVLFPEAR